MENIASQSVILNIPERNKLFPHGTRLTDIKFRCPELLLSQCPVSYGTIEVMPPVYVIEYITDDILPVIENFFTRNNIAYKKSTYINTYRYDYLTFYKLGDIVCGKPYYVSFEMKNLENQHDQHSRLIPIERIKMPRVFDSVYNLDNCYLEFNTNQTTNTVFTEDKQFPIYKACWSNINLVAIDQNKPVSFIGTFCTRTRDNDVQIEDLLFRGGQVIPITVGNN